MLGSKKQPPVHYKVEVELEQLEHQSSRKALLFECIKFVLLNRQQVPAAHEEMCKVRKGCACRLQSMALPMLAPCFFASCCPAQFRMPTTHMHWNSPLTGHESPFCPLVNQQAMSSFEEQLQLEAAQQPHRRRRRLPSAARRITKVRTAWP